MRKKEYILEVFKTNFSTSSPRGLISCRLSFFFLGLAVLITEFGNSRLDLESVLLFQPDYIRG